MTNLLVSVSYTIGLRSFLCVSMSGIFEGVWQDCQSPQLENGLSWLQVVVEMGFAGLVGKEMEDGLVNVVVWVDEVKVLGKLEESVECSVSKSLCVSYQRTSGEMS
jgi:hypothetical protein